MAAGPLIRSTVVELGMILVVPEHINHRIIEIYVLVFRSNSQYSVSNSSSMMIWTWVKAPLGSRRGALSCFV